MLLYVGLVDVEFFVGGIFVVYGCDVDVVVVVGFGCLCVVGCVVGVMLNYILYFKLGCVF